MDLSRRPAVSYMDYHAGHVRLTSMVMPNEVLKTQSNDFISNIKESVDVTFAIVDDKQLEALNKSATN
jgi:hypothetical protein